MNSDVYDSLLRKAIGISEKAYAPYSKIHVGAALLCEENRVFLGINVENSSYGLTVCAERNALAQGVMNNVKEYKAIAVYSPEIIPILPCGACRQVLSEFNPHLPIVFMDNNKEVKTVSLSKLFPTPFTLSTESFFYGR